MGEDKNTLLRENLDLINTGQEILKEISDKHEKVRERALVHTYQLITAIGIVAGFGFTGMGSIEDIGMFFFGEVFLIVSMAIGMWFAKAGFIDEANYLYKWHKQISDILGYRMDIKQSDSFEKMKSKMENAKYKELNLFKEDIKLPDFYWLTIVLVLFIIGGVLILLSFI